MFARVNIQASFRLRADPRTLRPYYLQDVRTARIRPGARGVSQVETRTFRVPLPALSRFEPGAPIRFVMAAMEPIEAVNT